MILHSKPTIGEDDIEAVNAALKSRFIAQGKLVQEFEKRLSQYVGTRYAAAVNSGTSALHLVLLAFGIKKGDEVIIPSLTCTALLNAISYVGAKTVIADVDKHTMNISLDTIKDNLSRKTKAVIVPYMFGNITDIQRICKFCQTNKIKVIEDCAQSLGAYYKGKRLGSFGDAAVFSFYATKLITTGEGGMILTNHRPTWNAVIDLRDYDKKSSKRTRFNYKMTDVQAAMGICQLKKLPLFLEKRKKIAESYSSQIENSMLIEMNNSGLKAIVSCRSCSSRNSFYLTSSSKTKVFDGRISEINKHHLNEYFNESIYYRYLIKVRDAGATIHQLKASGISAARCVFKPLKHLKNANWAFKHMVSIPIYPSLKKNEVKAVVKAVNNLKRKNFKMKSIKQR